MTQLPLNLAMAWEDRADKNTAILDAARRAPALFRPEYVERLADETYRARGMSRYWLASAGVGA